jgi:ABC-type phosphate transport system substrate-binding protein
MKRKLILGLLAGAATLVTSVSTTHADPPAGSGWDKNPDVVLGGGSDTTYLVSQRLEVLFSGAPGCAVVTSSTNVSKGKCNDVGVAPTGVVNGNYDHDVFVSATPTGSGAGVQALLAAGPQYNPPIDYARSSRAPAGTEANELTFFGYARDGIAVVTFGSRGSIALTKTQLLDIYVNCTLTDWSQVPGQPAGAIIPWDMNAASGTRAAFLTYLGVAALGPCVRKLSPSAVAPFENDVKPLLADAGPDGVVDTADDDENNYLWWISFGDWVKYPFTANGFRNGVATNPAVASNLVTVDGTTPSTSSIFGSTYAIMRTLFQVARNTDADCVTPAGGAGACNNAANIVSGNSLGKGGAVREFTQWLCRSNAATHTTNTVTGANYRNEIVAALNNEGFQQLSTLVPGLRTPGYACQIIT